ncbi:MAG: Ig-like domain-containing protein, partial [Chlamydiales bacterium]|nr:Ig-like domain-containing protein [Chlamydiales bacterium]
LTYTAAADQFGTSIVTVTYQDDGSTADGGFDTTTKTFTITIDPVNDAPTATSDSFSGIEDNQISDNVLTNDSDLENDPLTVTLDVGPTNGVVVLNPDGTFTYTPNLNYYGPDSFSYILSDGNLTSTATANLDITPVNDAPLAVSDNFSGTEDNQISDNVLGNDSDVENDSLTVTLDTGPVNGVVVLNPDGTFTYTPNSNYFGPDSFSYTLSDGSLTSTATVNLDITPANDAPTAVNDAFSGPEDSAISGNVLTNDSDLDSATLTTTLNTGPLHGSVIVNLDGSFTYNPDLNYVGSDTFSYDLSDGGLIATATVNLTVTSVNDAPVALNDAYIMPEDSVLNGNVLSNDSDVDGPAVAVSLVIGPTHGTLTLNSNGTFTYTPTLNYFGVDSFVYRLSDGLLSSQAIATINITPINDTIVAVNDNYTVFEDQSVGGNVLDNDTDVDTPHSNFFAFIQTNPAHGSVTINLNGTFVYTPQANFFGADFFTYLAFDSAISSSPARVDINVQPVNDAPTITAGAGQTVLEDSGQHVINNFATNISVGPVNESTSQTLSFVLTNNNPSLFSEQPSINAAGTLVFKPAADQFGAAVVTITAKDSGGTSNGGEDTTIRTFVINVNSVNDAPTFVAGAEVVTSGSDPVAIPDFVQNISPGPANESSQSVFFDVSVDNPNLFATPPSIDPSGKLSFTPAVDVSGPAVVKVTLFDSGGTANGGFNGSTQFFTIFLNTIRMTQPIPIHNDTNMQIPNTYYEPNHYNDPLANPEGFLGVDGFNQMTNTGEMIGFDSLEIYNANLTSLMISKGASSSWDASSSNFFNLEQVLDVARQTLGFTSDSGSLAELLDKAAHGDSSDDLFNDTDTSYDRLLDLLVGE